MENPELDFETGIEVGREETLADIENQLVDQGFDPGDVEQLLYDPAPRRKKGSKKGKKHKAHRTYDPAPRRRYSRMRRYDPPGKRNGYRKKAKGALAKLKPYVGIGVGGLTFYGAYTKRTADLKAAGSIPATATLIDAVMYDVNHFNGNDAMVRVQKNMAGIAAPGLLGWGVKKFVGGTWGKIAGDALIGFAGGTALKTVLDPPVKRITSPPSERTNTIVSEHRNIRQHQNSCCWEV